MDSANIKAVILAAGRGNRLGDFGNKMPKCLIKYKGRTLIQRALQILMNCGINDITVVVGFEKDQLKNHVKESFPDKIIKFIFNPDYLNKENIYSVWCARKEFNHDLIMMDADLLLNQSVIDQILNFNKKNFFVVRKEIHADEMIVLLKNKIVIELSQNPNTKKLKFDQIVESVGIMKFSRIAAKNLIEEINILFKNGNLNQYYEAAVNNILKKIDFSILQLNDNSIVVELDTIEDVTNLTKLGLAD